MRTHLKWLCSFQLHYFSLTDSVSHQQELPNAVVIIWAVLLLRQQVRRNSSGELAARLSDKFQSALLLALQTTALSHAYILMIMQLFAFDQTYTTVQFF